MKYQRFSSSVMPPEISISADDVTLYGELSVPPRAVGVVLFAHGSGSSRHSPRNQYVARVLREAGIGSLLFDLLTPQEEDEDEHTGVYRFDIKLLARRLLGATLWLEDQKATRGLKLGYFGSSTGGAAALMAAAALGTRIAAVVSRGGRPDLAGDALPNVQSPTLLLVGGLDDVVIQLNQRALMMLRCQKEMHIIPGASHLFEEYGKLEQVAQLSAEWFHDWMTNPEPEHKKP